MSYDYHSNDLFSILITHHERYFVDVMESYSKFIRPYNILYLDNMIHNDLLDMENQVWM